MSDERAVGAIPLADHDEIWRKVSNLPWDVQKAIVTIAAHCVALKDEHSTGPVSDLAGCISDNCLDLANALTAPPKPAPAVREALKPFADFASRADLMPDDFVITKGSGMARRQLTIGDCRKARDALAPPVPSSDGAGEPVAWGRPHVEYSASRGQSRVEYWVSREDGKRIETGLATPPIRADREASVPAVERIECVQGFLHEEAADPMWRVNVSGYCADFYTETAANNFRNAILSLDVQPGAGEREARDNRFCPNGLEHGNCLHPGCVPSCPGRLALSRQPGEQR